MKKRISDTPSEPKLRAENSIKKKIIVALCAVVLAIVVLFLAIYVLEIISNALKNKDVENDFIFYEADYSENIYDDAEYVSLVENGFISFCNVDNITLSIDEEDASAYGRDVDFIVKYIRTMINGDVDAYNDCYSDLYYSEEEPKDNFTKQKIYDVMIKKISEQTMAEKDGTTYVKYVYSLNYRILKNNGTLRDDFLNGSRTQYLYITDRSGELKIDGVTVLNTIIK